VSGSAPASPPRWPALTVPGAEIITFGGNCPVQAEGTVGPYHWYFRARGNAWSMHVAATPGALLGPQELYCVRHPYGAEPFEAGWMPQHTALAFINQALADFLTQHPLPQASAPSAEEPAP